MQQMSPRIRALDSDVQVKSVNLDTHLVGRPQAIYRHLSFHDPLTHYSSPIREI